MCEVWNPCFDAPQGMIPKTKRGGTEGEFGGLRHYIIITMYEGASKLWEEQQKMRWRFFIVQLRSCLVQSSWQGIQLFMILLFQDRNFQPESFIYSISLSLIIIHQLGIDYVVYCFS